MIHELIDPKKKTARSTTGRNVNNKAYPDNSNFEQSDCECKEAESSSTTFILPWLRNSLGFNQRDNQNNALSDQKSARIIPRYREHIQDEFDAVKTSTEQDCSCNTDRSEAASKNCPAEAVIGQISDCQISSHDKPLSVLWNTRQKESESESKFTNLDVKSLRAGESKMTNADILSGAEIGKLKDEETRKLKYGKQKNRLRRRVIGDTKAADKDDMDFLLELKARGILDNYLKKDFHSVSSDVKQLEAKLILLGAKYHNADSPKLTSQDLRLLQEIRNQSGNKEDFDRLLEHVKELNLRDFKACDDGKKSFGDKMKRFEEREEKAFSRDNFQLSRYHDADKLVPEKDSLMSTDDESDIKRFSEFLSKNKNHEEKRKCLEEVRNYFERKRRTRLSKRRHLEETKTPRQLISSLVEGKHEPLGGKPKQKDIFTLTPGKDKKSKLGFCDEEIVEKAVNETLQKFVDLYHFQVSPTALTCMRKKILQAVQTNSLDGIAQLEHDVTLCGEAKEEAQEKKPEKDGEKEKGKAKEEELEKQDRLAAYPCNLSPSKDTLFSGKEAKKRTFKTLVDGQEAQGHKSGKEGGSAENENMKRLKKEFENFLNTILAHADVRGLKLQSVILEKDEPTSSSKSLQFVYNFSKKVLDSNKAEIGVNSELRNLRDSGTQTPGRGEMKKNAVAQTSHWSWVGCERSSQTEHKDYVSHDAQTESDINVTRLEDLKDLKGFNITPGLYRMIRSSEPGRLYLYPEKPEEAGAASRRQENDPSSVLKVCESVVMDRKRRDALKRMPPKDRGAKEKQKKLRRRKEERKRGYLCCSSALRIASKRRDLVADGERAKASRNGTSFKSPEEGPPRGQGTTKKEGASEPPGREEQFDCTWLWNGEKITPGCDLKTHVEDLLREKLKEISHYEFQNKCKIHGSLHSNSEHGQVVRSKSSEKNLEIKNTNALFCFRRLDRTQEESLPLLFAGETDFLSNRNTTEGDEEPDTEDKAAPAAKDRPVRDVATQKSQLTILSLNIAKLESQSKLGNLTAKIGKKIRRKKRFIMKSAQQARDIASFKKTADIIRVVQQIRRLRGEGENGADTASTEEGSSTSVPTKRDALSAEETLSLVLGLAKNDDETDGTQGESSPPRKAVSVVDHEVQTKSSDKSAAAQSPMATADNLKHWELIERVLNRVSHRERECLWNDMREFIKTKIGRDINDDGAREVCIEIEQDLPTTSQGRTKQAIIARGHYMRNEGDVEVEIDLTLDDLERILRHRQRKMRRRQECCRRTKRMISSSSAQSDVKKDGRRRSDKYFQKFRTLASFVKEKHLNAGKINRDN